MIEIFIGIEDLAANAFIALIPIAPDRRFLTYSVLEKYGNMVVSILNCKENRAVLLLSRDRTDAMLQDYSDCFEEKEDGQLGVSLKENVSVDYLISKFRGCLALDTLMAFIDSRALETLEIH